MPTLTHSTPTYMHTVTNTHTQIQKSEYLEQENTSQNKTPQKIPKSQISGHIHTIFIK